MGGGRPSPLLPPCSLFHPPLTFLAFASMASSSQQGASSRQPAAPGAQGVERLPDELLTRILAGLSLMQRCECGGRGPVVPPPPLLSPRPPLPLNLAAAPLACRQHAVLVCRRWYSCAHTPELCREVDVEISAQEEEKPSEQLA